MLLWYAVDVKEKKINIFTKKQSKIYRVKHSKIPTEEIKLLSTNYLVTNI